MSIIVNNITGQGNTSTRRNLYKDLHFPVAENVLPESDTLYGKVTRTDLQASVDEQAVLNSLKNIFTTTPGEKVLNPEFGLNLTQWLFEPASEFTAREIGEAIQDGIQRFEPRVLLTRVSVIVDEENNQYLIKLAIQIPSLNITKEYDAVLQQPGFEFLTPNE